MSVEDNAEDVNEEPEAEQAEGEIEQDVASASNESEAISDEGNAEEQPEQEANEEESAGKPEAEPEVDWKKVAEKERWKRKRGTEENQRLKSENEELKSSKAPAQQAISSRPRRPSQTDEQFADDFDDSKYNAALDKYDDDLYDYKTEQRETKQAAAKQKKEGEALVQTYQTKLADYNAKNPDFGKAMEEAGNPVLGQILDQVLFESENGPAIEHYLYDHLDQLEEIRQAHPIHAVRMAMEIEAKLAAPKPEKPGKKTATRRVSNAPAPVEKVKGSSNTTDEFAAMFPTAKIRRSS